MEIPLDKLTALVNEAFERGMSGCSDLKQQDIEELFGKYQIRETEDFRVWSVDELRKMPEGTCWIVSRANGTRFMQFDRGQAIDFNTNIDPWDKPMRLIYSER